MKITRRIILLALFSSVIIQAGCEKLIEVDNPKNQLTADDVFKEAATINAALVNLYATIDRTVEPNFNKWICLLSDDFAYTGSGTSQQEFYQGNLSITNGNVKTYWSGLYSIVYACNDFIEQINKTTVLDSKTASTYISEARFLRAFSYFYLLHCFDNVPLILTTEVGKNRQATQADSHQVYEQIKRDLNDAIIGFTDGIEFAGSKTRANKWAAISLLARTYLFNKEWENASTLASEVIGSGIYDPLGQQGDAFSANSKETILELWNQNGFIADGTSLIPASGIPQFVITQDLLESFEDGDFRKSSWIRTTEINDETYYHPYKYQNRTNNTASPEYLKLLRISEQYLIRAEAKINLGDIDGGIEDLNLVRERAGLSPLSGDRNPEVYLKELLNERRREFFGEWGHRYLDLKRLGLLSQTMGYLKPTWDPKSVALPIPSTEITYNPNLNQNSGY